LYAASAGIAQMKMKKALRPRQFYPKYDHENAENHAPSLIYFSAAFYSILPRAAHALILLKCNKAYFRFLLKKQTYPVKW